jgi:hypothetical protein
MDDDLFEPMNQDFVAILLSNKEFAHCITIICLV